MKETLDRKNHSLQSRGGAGFKIALSGAKISVCDILLTCVAEKFLMVIFLACIKSNSLKGEKESVLPVKAQGSRLEWIIIPFEINLS